MPSYRIGRATVELTVLRPVARGEMLPLQPEFKGVIPKIPGLEERESADLAAFRDAGWRFGTPVDPVWAFTARPEEGPEIEAGLLARHSKGGLVILSDRLVVSFSPQADARRIAALLQQRYRSHTPLRYGVNLYQVQLPLPVQQGLEKLIDDELRFLEGEKAAGVVAFFEPSIIYHFVHPGEPPKASAAPVISKEVDDWHWKLIGLRAAWDTVKELGKGRGKGIRVAVIDYGFHPKDDQISERVDWVAYVGYVGGKLAVRFDPKVVPQHFHGTLCASIVGAKEDDKSVAGAAPDCQLILVAVPASTPQEILGEAIAVCASGDGTHAGADVITCSLAPKDNNLELGDPLRTAIDEALAGGRPQPPPGTPRGTTVIWAAGNTDKKIEPDTVESYADVMSVSQCNDKGKRVNSRYGPELALIAPGSGVNGLVYGSAGVTVKAQSGSSVAAPCTAGVAALVLAVDDSLNWRQLHEVITRSCEPQPAQGEEKKPDDESGWGLLNAARAVTRVIPLALVVTPVGGPAGPAATLSPIPGAGPRAADRS